MLDAMVDNLNENNVSEIASKVNALRINNLLNKVLISHDAGWYDPAMENGGEYRGYNTLFEKLIPALKVEGLTEEEINTLLVKNPAHAFQISIRKLRN